MTTLQRTSQNVDKLEREVLRVTKITPTQSVGKDITGLLHFDPEPLSSARFDFFFYSYVQFTQYNTRCQHKNEQK
jgi:hypothetical protein